MISSVLCATAAVYGLAVSTALFMYYRDSYHEHAILDALEPLTVSAWFMNFCRPAGMLAIGASGSCATWSSAAEAGGAWSAGMAVLLVFSADMSCKSVSMTWNDGPSR